MTGFKKRQKRIKKLSTRDNKVKGRGNPGNKLKFLCITYGRIKIMKVRFCSVSKLSSGQPLRMTGESAIFHEVWP